jgi:hypothetical protein
MGVRGPHERSTRPSGVGVDVSERRYRSSWSRWKVRAYLVHQYKYMYRIGEYDGMVAYRLDPSVSHTSLYSSTEETTNLGYPLLEAALIPSISSSNGSVFRRS